MVTCPGCHGLGELTHNYPSWLGDPSMMPRSAYPPVTCATCKGKCKVSEVEAEKYNKRQLGIELFAYFVASLIGFSIIVFLILLTLD